MRGPRTGCSRRSSPPLEVSIRIEIICLEISSIFLIFLLLIDAEAEAARLRQRLRTSIPSEKVAEMLDTKLAEFHDELKRARESMKTAALLQQEH